MSDVVKATEQVSRRVQELTYLLAAIQLSDWWDLLVKEPDETLEELTRFLRVPCGNEVHDKRSEQGIICIQRELLGRSE